MAFVRAWFLLLVFVLPVGAGSQELLQKLAETKDPEAKAILIGQIQFVAKDDAIPVLAPYLADERLCEPAARALVAIGTPPAAEALLQALQTAHVGRLISVVQALGDLAYAPSIPAVQRFATADDAAVRHVAWYTLARCGDASLIPVLMKARETDRLVATTELFRLARLLKDGTVSRSLIEKDPTPAEYSQALLTLAEVEGERVLPDAREALQTGETSVRLTALQVLASLSSVRARTVLRTGIQDTNTAVRIATLATIVRLNDQARKNACRAALSDTNQLVREEAIRGLKDSPEALLDFLPHASKTDIEEIARVLQTVPREEIVARWNKADAGMKVALLRVMGVLHGGEIDRIIENAAEDPDDNVRLTALTVLKGRLMPPDLTRALVLLGRARSEQEVQKLRALAIGLGRELANGQAEQPVLVAMEQAKSPGRERFYPLLSEFGGTNALAAMIRETQQSEPSLQEAAVKALVEWREPAAIPVLLELSRNGKTETHRVLAARGAMRLAEQSKAGAETWRKILEAAPREEEKQQAQAVLRKLEGTEKK